MKSQFSTRRNLAMAVLKREILDHTVIRRTKLECADVLSLPPRYFDISCTVLCRISILGGTFKPGGAPISPLLQKEIGSAATIVYSHGSSFYITASLHFL